MENALLCFARMAHMKDVYFVGHFQHECVRKYVLNKQRNGQYLYSYLP